VSVCKTAEPISLGEYDSDAFHIQDEIRKVAKNLPKSDSLGLHYTGGTKAMSIHAYGAMLSLDRSDVVFSYLDPRRLEVCIDRKDDGRIHHNVAIAVKPSLEKVFQLHGKVCEKTPIQEVKLPDFAKKLAILHSDEQKSKDWFKWFYDEICCENLRKKKGNGDWGDWRGKQILEKLEISISNLPQEAIDGFIEHGFISSEGLLSFAKVHETQKFAKLEHFCEWLGGLWLEYQVLQVIKDISGNRLIHDYGMDFKVPTGSGKNFQFDVAFFTWKIANCKYHRVLGFAHRNNDGGFARYRWKQKTSIRLALDYLRVQGDDKLSTNPPRMFRNFNFRNDIFDLALGTIG
jgi:hypothetical protein